ncbi:DNRLRE domain-containing protein [Luteolibacter yonseiensis]|uniref:DNRLRE domain-containing protein n=1 Tax=Luteolibacter yonseiensis TaxID=1144680 RepID=A0A934VA75_9BACT|nr:DNRLRE domain-containing protein [Luteolibacter yonseiensis]MBK1814566.1 DNRLRE domain-containing protein [Luteolibacter yonseiensis]
MKFKHLSSLPLAIFAASCAQTWAAEPVTIVFQNGLKHPADPSELYNGEVDRQITLTGGSSGTTMNIDGGGDKWGDSAYSNALLRFNDIETIIPQGAKIIEAKLTVVAGTGGNDHSGDIFQVYRLTREFDSSSSMATRDGVVGFGDDGVIGDSDWLLGTFRPPNVTGGLSASTDITRAVQSWVDGSPNYGIGINPNRGTNAWIFNSSGATNPSLRPKLEVTYILGDDAKSVDYQQGLNGYTGAADMILNRNGATSTTPGNSELGRNFPNEKGLDGLNPANTNEADIPGLLRFDGIEQSLTGRKIEKATLKFVTGGFGTLNADKNLVFVDDSSHSSGPFTVHRLLVPFTETTKYGPTGSFTGESGKLLAAGNIITPAVATLRDMARTEVVDVDVTEAVKAWAAGAQNNGLYIGAGTPDAWAFYFSGATNAARRPVLNIVSSEIPPVTITSPVNASRHTIGTPFDLQATTTSPATKVDFVVDGETFQSDESNPFSVSFPADKFGNFTLRATMTRPDLTTVSSEDVKFSVLPPAGVGGLYFDGAADHVTLGNPAALKLSTFTLETWFRRETKGTSTNTGGVVAIPLIAKGREQADSSALDMNWFLGIRESDGVLCADFEGTGANAAAGGGVNAPVVGRTPVPFGQWQHAAAAFDGTHWRLYLNGNLEAVVEAPKINGNPIIPRADSVQHASIASALNSGGLPEGAFGGFIDEARVWNVARTQVQIRETINSELETAGGLVARFGMSEGSGTSITSSVAPNLVGTFVSAPVWATGQTYNGSANPTIRFLSPAEGLSITNTTPLTYTVEASDPDGTISKVEYYDNDILVATVTTPPYSFTYATPPVAIRRMVAVVYDNLGNSSRTDNILTTSVNYNSPTVPGYSAGIIDGKDVDLATGTELETEAASPAPWTVLASTAAPRAFTGLGTDSGDIAVNINGTAAPFNAGVLLTTNTSLNGNLAPYDNVVAPYNADGVYHVSSRDNSGPGDAHPTTAPESSSFSLGWFPFAQGWTGANIAADGTVIAGSSNLPATARITRPTNDQGVIAGTYHIYGLPMTGNVIVVSAGNDSDNVASVVRSGDNWIVTTRDNFQTTEDSDFTILYIPSTATRVLSGWLNQKTSTSGDFETTALNGDLATLGFTVNQTARGYELTFGDGSAINPSNTALFICADNNPGQSNNGGDNIYHYSAAGNSFLIFSQDLPGLNRANQASGFRFLATPINPTLPGANEVSITPIRNSTAEDDADATLKFQVSRSGATTGDQVVNYTVSGTATSGSDFTPLTGSVTIPAGAASAEIVVSLLKDSTLEQDETVIITLAAGPGYTPGSSTSAAGVIQDSRPVFPTTTLVFQEGNNYTGQFQLQISDQGTTRLGSTIEVYGVDGGIPDVNDLMRFDNIFGNTAGRIPSNAKILDASLTITVGGSTNDTSPGPFVVDRLTVPVDATTTHDSISNGNSGPLQGARGGSARTPVAGFPRLALNAVGSANVTSILREWASGMPNYGFSIYDGGTSDALSYGTVGHKTLSKRPKLTVTYTTVPVREYTLFGDRSSVISYKSGTSTVDGATLEGHIGTIVSDPLATKEAFLKFPFAFDGSPNSIPANEEIVRAELLIHTNGEGDGEGEGQSSTPTEIHQVLQDWTPATSYGLNGPVIGEHVAESTAALTGLGQNSTTAVDVTSIIRNWRAGAPNFGFYLKPKGGNDNWTFYFPGAAADVAPRLRIFTIGGDAPEGNSFEAWAASFDAAGITMDSDNDHDGITALVEYALGFNPTTPNVLPTALRNGNQFSLSFPKGTLAANDPRISYRIVSSTDLGVWTAESSAVNDPTAISLTHTLGADKKFFRLEVVHTP